jgi:hypothetical protein
MRVKGEGTGCTSQELTVTADRRPLPDGDEGLLHKARGARPRATLCFLSVFDYLLRQLSSSAHHQVLVQHSATLFFL